MRVFCPEHKKGFFAPRQSPIRCENRGHTLGELDFEGSAKLPALLQWQYCCNCEHFCPIDFAQDGLERCPVCTRRSSLIHLCNRCFTVSFESNTPLETKNFTLTAEGAPKPSCPGCLQPASVDLREHVCLDLGATLSTALDSCPVCHERLDIGPSFPSSLQQYLRRTRAAHKLNVTFDYETALFVPVDDGEFVVISSSEAIQPLVLPRFAHFSTPRVFYDFYQDYYHCANPDAGEVHIHEPALVVKVEAGWKFEAHGSLEVIADKRRKPRPAVAASQTEKAQPAETRVTSQPAEESATPCTRCGELIETRYPFCWKCGNAMTQPRAKHGDRSRNAEALADELSDTDEQTVQHESHRPVRSQIFFDVLEKESDGPRYPKRSVLKLLAVALLGVLSVSIGLFVLTRAPEKLVSASEAEALSPTAPSPESSAPSPEIEIADVPESAPAKASPVDAELTKLRELRTNSKSSNRSAIFKTIARAEGKYPDDYRFPYERAKLAVSSRRESANTEAFAALARAAEKAINSGKAREMLDSLLADKTGAFRRLAQAHREWTQLLETLKSKNVRVLKARLSASGRT